MRFKRFKTFKIITFGCRVNQAESRMMGEKIVKQLPNSQASRNKKADLVIINSCSVTHKAEREVRKEIRRVKRENPNCFLVVAGCWVEKVKDKKLEILKQIDLLIGNKNKLKWIKKFKKSTSSFIPTALKSSKLYQDKYAKSKKALLKIQTGCNNFCSYCLVPYLRGRSRSRYADEILKEIKGLIKNGIQEIILTGVDIADFRFKVKTKKLKDIIKNLELDKLKNDLAKLIKLILTETKIKKISFGSMGLEIFNQEFIKLYQGHHLRLSTHFHIPLQSGCDETLTRMGRKYTMADFQLTISNLRKNIPNFTFSTDLIVGFPGESESEFKKTVASIKTIKTVLGRNFTKIHIFRYSSREGTLAQKMEGRKNWELVDERIKKKRFYQINRLFKTFYF